jgi:hypothetical protein
MNPIRHIRRVATALAGLACAWLGIAATAPAAFAVPLPPSGGGPAGVTPPLPVQVHTVMAGGMPGWQIALIAAGAALITATAAVLVYRAWVTGRKPVPAAA